MERAPAASVRTLHVSLVLWALYFIPNHTLFRKIQNQVFQNWLFALFLFKSECKESVKYRILSQVSVLVKGISTGTRSCLILFPHTHLFLVFALTAPLALCLTADLAPCFILPFFLEQSPTHACQVPTIPHQKYLYSKGSSFAIFPQCLGVWSLPSEMVSASINRCMSVHWSQQEVSRADAC